MTQEPRPAFFSVGELFGGVERHLLGMCKWLQRQGREPLLILFHDHELARQARELGVEPVILSSAGSYDLSVPRKLAVILAKRDINVVHAHGYRALVNAALARKHHRFAVVRTVHGLVEGKGLLSASAWKGRIYTWLEQRAARRANAAVCYVTRDLQQAYARADRGLDVCTIHNGIDPLQAEDFPRPPDLETGVFHFAAVGRVSQVKGLQFALEAMQRLDQTRPIVLNIIGTGPLAETLRAAAQARGLGNRVRFLGFKENIYDYLAHIDCLIMPSLHEGLPYTILEAMSLGTPILASRIGGLAEVLDHGQNALLIEVGDVDALAAAMGKLAGDPALGAALGQAGRTKQAAELSLEPMGAAYWGIYADGI